MIMGVGSSLLTKKGSSIGDCITMTQYEYVASYLLQFNPGLFSFYDMPMDGDEGDER